MKKKYNTLSNYVSIAQTVDKEKALAEVKKEKKNCSIGWIDWVF